MQKMLNSKRAYIYKWYIGVLNSWRDTARKKQFPSPNTLTGILPSSDNLDSNNETELTCLAHGAKYLVSVLPLFFLSGDRTETRCLVNDYYGRQDLNSCM